MVRYLRENDELKRMPLECIKGATLLSKEEAENLLTQEERKCKGTQQAINNGLWVAPNGSCDYWLRSAGAYNYCACGVNCKGGVSRFYDVNDTDTGIRPALILNLQSSNLKVGDSFEFGGYMFKIISNNLSLCDVIIDVCPFNQSYIDGNDYETSYIKTRVDDWFRKVYKDMEYKEAGVDTDDEIFNGKKGEWAGW